MKISALTAATTPLSGAELFPIVQSGNTRRVTLNDLLRSIGNGTAAAPALAPGGDPNTGIYFPAADTIGFVEGGVEVMRIDANGRVGIGASSPLGRLHIAGSTASFIFNTTGTELYNTNSGAVKFYASNAAGFLSMGAGGRDNDLILSATGNFSVDTNTLFVDAVNNRVGVGTTSTIAQLCNTATSDSITGVQPTGFVWRSTDNDWAAAIISRPASGLSYGLRVHSGGATASDYPLWVSSGAGTGTGLLQLNGAGNLGLGVTPTAGWNPGGNIQIRDGGVLASFGTYLHSATNLYYDNSATPWRYRTTGTAMRFSMEDGVFAWFRAPSGTAGNAITFTQAMTLDASGNLGVGTTTPNIYGLAAGRFSTVSNSAASGYGLFSAAGGAGGGGQIDFGNQSIRHAAIASLDGSILGFYTNGTNTGAALTQRWQINSSGHLLAGADNTYDIGASGATRPRDLHLARNLVGAGWLRAGAASAGAASTTTIGGTTATTVGAAGAASALPANPLGYIVAHVGTTEVRIPYYNA